ETFDIKSITNIQNKDNKCFHWSILDALHPAGKYENRVSKYKECNNEFNEIFKNLKIEFSVKLKDITKFEKKTNMSINVFTYEDNRNISPLQVCDIEKETHINLFYLSEKNKEHYCLIKNLSRLVVSQITRHCEFGIDKHNIKTISNSEENYISLSNIRYEKIDSITKGKPIFKIVEIRFLDSFRFLSSSLENLANILKPYQFKELSTHYPIQLDLVKGKLAYLYDNMNSPDEETLRNIDQFYSSLTGEHVTQNAYENAKKIWETFKTKNMRDLTILYDKIYVLLLTDIIGNYRAVSLRDFKLNPVIHYYTTPGYT
ncbi:Ribonuclease H-like domain, partial [Cinara cedri]